MSVRYWEFIRKLNDRWRIRKGYEIRNGEWVDTWLSKDIKGPRK